MSNLSWRVERALRAFEKEVVLRYYDLPRGVGRDTMRVLIAKGLVELVDKNIGEFAKDRRWRRTRMQKWKRTPRKRDAVSVKQSREHGNY